MLFDVYKCSRCDYEQIFPEDRFTVTHYLYRLPSGFFFEAGKMLGWCDSCSRISNVETLSVEHIRSYANRLVLLNQTIAQNKSCSVLARLKELYQNRKAVKGLEKLIGLLSLRDHPKCLSCGTAMISKISPDKKFVHKICGGSIVCERRDDGANWDFDPKHISRYYSAAGTFLFEERS